MKKLARIGLSVNHERHIDDGLTAEEIDNLNDAQLKRLARIGAYVNHDWYIDEMFSHGRFPSGGHTPAIRDMRASGLQCGALVKLINNGSISSGCH